mmetsp:Transcript_12955/g.34440  ORF Transcript_12955/g.34440 Transcript_12955/m.34440 type:complete len:228 (-) Transcript_12955:5-688(-)
MREAEGGARASSSSANGRASSSSQAAAAATTSLSSRAAAATASPSPDADKPDGKGFGLFSVTLADGPSASVAPNTLPLPPLLGVSRGLQLERRTRLPPGTPTTLPTPCSPGVLGKLGGVIAKGSDAADVGRGAGVGVAAVVVDGDADGDCSVAGLAGGGDAAAAATATAFSSPAVRAFRASRSDRTPLGTRGMLLCAFGADAARAPTGPAAFPVVVAVVTATDAACR